VLAELTVVFHDNGGVGMNNDQSIGMAAASVTLEVDAGENQGVELNYEDLTEINLTIGAARGEGDQIDETLYITATMGESGGQSLYVSARENGDVILGGSIGPLASSPQPERVNQVGYVAESPAMVNLDLSRIPGMAGVGRNLTHVMSMVGLEEENEREETLLQEATEDEDDIGEALNSDSVGDEDEAHYETLGDDDDDYEEMSLEESLEILIDRVRQSYQAVLRGPRGKGGEDAIAEKLRKKKEQDLKNL